MSQSLPPMPNEFPHIFTSIAWEILPEINYDDIVYLSVLAKGSNRVASFEPMIDSLQKAQRARLSGNEAMIIDATCVKDDSPGTVYQDPVGQIRHTKALMEFVFHLKSAIDSLAVFLNDYFSIGLSGGDRDFRKSHFKEKAVASNPRLASFIDSEFAWFDLNSSSTDSIVAVRDEWIHRTSPDVALIQPPTQEGIFPIPKDLKNSLPSRKVRSTQDFVQHHWTRYTKFFTLLLEIAIEKERANLKSPPSRPQAAEMKISVLKTVFSETLTTNKMSMGFFTRAALGGIPLPPAL